MQICDKQYQSLNISASPSFATAQGRENERRDWTEETYQAKNKQPGNRYDWSRKHLNFEIKRGQTMIMKNGQTHYIKPRIIPLGSQRKTLKQRYEQRLKELDYKPWAKDAPNQPNTCVDFVISGDHDRMTEIAFSKPMDLDWQEDNGNATLADDPNCRGRKQIETMALDYYDFLCQKFGEVNVIGFECHLDETTPHFHALVIPVAERVKRGKVGGYELNSDIKSDGKERPEHITTRQFGRMSEDEQMFYRPAEKKKVLAVSYSHYFGETRFAASQSYKQWHTMLHDEVGDKWGLSRGEDTSLMTAEERKEHRKKNKRQLERERLEALKKAEEAEKKALETEKKIDQAAWALDNFESSLAEKREASSRLNDMIDNARQELNNINKEKETARNEKNELELRARELADAVGDPSESVAFNGFCDAVFTYNPKSSGAIIENLKAKGKTKMTMMDVIMAAFQEVDKVRNQRESVFTNAEEFRRQQNNEIKSIMTDMQTILRSFDSAHIEELIRRSRAIVKQELRQNAIAIRKIQQYDEMTRRGISEESYNTVVEERDTAREKASHFPITQEMLDIAWPGLRKARDVLTDPTLDKMYMNKEQRDTVKNALRPKPEESIGDILDVLKYVQAFRPITQATKSEAIRLAAETGIKHLSDKGIDLVKEAAAEVKDIADDLNFEVSDMSNRVASTAICLFFGFLDAATTISESSGGSGGNITELTGWDGRKKDEDDKTFAERCLQTAIAMHTPQQRRLDQTRGRKWGW